MQKRVIISIILTILTLVLAHNYWLTLKPISFRADIMCQNDAYMSIVLNRKNNLEFNKTYQETKKITSKTKNFEVFFKRKTPPKRLKITLSNTKPNSKYKISNLSFNNNYKIKNFEEFFSKDSLIKIENDTIIIIPKGTKAEIIYNKKISVYRPIEVNFKIFFIILILSYLLFYKLTSYLADFKLEKDVSRIDIIFLAVLFIILLIPISHINKDEISFKENRTLAKLPKLFNEDKSINLDFGKNFESYINDRFFSREILINLYKFFQFCISSKYYITPQAYLNKKTNWEFGDYDKGLAKLTNNDIIEITNELNKFEKFCANNNIKLYLLIVPPKSYIYSEETIDKKPVQDFQLDNINQIKKNSNFPVIFPYEELKQASKNDFVFFKTDHHWTDYGVFIGYQTLMNEIKKDFPNIKPLKKEDFIISQNNLVRSGWTREYHFGETSKYLLKLNENTAKKILDTKYNYFTHKNKKDMNVDIIDMSLLKQKDFNYKYGLDLKALMIGTSMNENLSEIIPYNFKKTRYIRLNDVIDVPFEEGFKIFQRYKQNIKNYNPDVMIFCITESNIEELKKLTKED